MKIKALRILPPIAIGRLGSAAEPVVNYEIEADPLHPLDFHRIKGAETFIVDRATGEIAKSFIPEIVSFKEVRGAGKEQTEHIRPVAPFLEVWALVEGEAWVPLTLDLLHANGLTSADLRWQVSVANRKVARRTADPDDEVSARTPRFSTHGVQRLEGHCRNFVSPDKAIDFGQVQYVKPTATHPEIRLRFTPAQGKIYGPKLSPKELERLYGPDWQKEVWHPPAGQAIYNPKESWLRFENFKPINPEAPPAEGVELERLQARETMPPSLYSIVPPGPCWLNDNVAISRGFFDDTCDGVVEVSLRLASGTELEAAARICNR